MVFENGTTRDIPWVEDLAFGFPEHILKELFTPVCVKCGKATIVYLKEVYPVGYQFICSREGCGTKKDHLDHTEDVSIKIKCRNCNTLFDPKESKIKSEIFCTSSCMAVYKSVYGNAPT